MTQNVAVGSYVVTLEQPKTSGSFLATTEEMCKHTKDAYNIMNLFQKLMLACGDTLRASYVKGYVNVCSVPYCISLLAGFPQMLKDTSLRSFYGVMEFAHNVTETTAMAFFSAAVFDPMNKTVGNAGVLFNALSDITEVPTFAMDAAESYTVLKLARKLEISDDVQSGLLSKLQHSLIKLTKAVCSSVTGIFSSYTVLYGAALITAATALTFGIIATSCNVFDYYHQNYLSDFVAKNITLVIP